MRYVAAVFILAVTAVECMPRPDGLGTPGVSAPTGLNGRDSAQVGGNISDDGEVEIKQNKTTTSESNDETSRRDAQEYEHTGPNGERVSQSSEKETTHSEREKNEESESNSMQVGKGGVGMSKDRSTTNERREKNTETGKQSFEQSSGNDPNHKHTYESGSEYKNTNQSYDQHRDESHDSFAIGPDLETSSGHSESSSDKHDEQQTAEGSSHTRQEDYDRDGNHVRHTGSASQNQYKNESAKSSSTSTKKEENKSRNGKSRRDDTNGGADGETGVGTDGTDAGLNSEADSGVDAGMDSRSDSRVDAGMDSGADAGAGSGSDTGMNGGTGGGTNANGGTNTDKDVGANAGIDAGTGVETNSWTNVDTDAATSIGTNSVSDTGMNGGTGGETSADGETNANTGVGANDGIDAGTGAETNSGTNVDTDAATSIGTNSASDTGMYGGTGGGTSANGGTDANTDVAANDGIDAGTDAETNSSTNADTDAGTNIGTNGGGDTGMDVGGTDYGTATGISNSESVGNYNNAQTYQGDTGAQTEVGSGANVDQTNVNSGQINAEDDTQRQIDASSNIQGDMDTNMDAQDQMRVQNDQKVDGDAEIAAGGQAQANGLKFDVQKEVYRQLERDEIALGLIREGQPSTESVETSKRDFLRVKNDYLLAVAQNIHNARIVGDGRGHARIVTPRRHSPGSRYSTDFLNLNSPYRTLAQRFGFSPVSSHYANAQFVESRFGNMPSLFESYQDKLLNTGNTQYGGEKTYVTGKSQHGVRSLFEGGDLKYGLSAANLQLSPLEWEERARKEADLRNAQFKGNKYMQSRFKKANKIDPLVKNVILSRDLDDILKNVKTSAEISSAIKTFELGDKFIAINKRNEPKNKNAEGVSNENEIFGHRKDKIVGKSNYRVTKPPTTTHRAIYGGSKDISQVVIRKVDLVSSDDRFDTSVISDNIMENTFNHPGYVHVGNVEVGENKVIYDSFDNPKIGPERKTAVNGLKYVNMENAYSTPIVENDTIKLSSSNSSFDSKVRSGSEEITVKDYENKKSEDLYNSTETNTDKSSEVTSDKTTTEVIFSSNNTALINDNVRTQYAINQTIETNSSYEFGDVNSTDYSADSQFSTSTDKSVTESSVDATAQASADNKTNEKRKTENEKVNEDNKTIDTIESESEVSAQSSTNQTEVISDDNTKLNVNNENLSITTGTNQVLVDDEANARKTEKEKVNEDSKTIDTLESESNVNTQGSANHSEIISVDNTRLNASSEDLNNTTETYTFYEEITLKTNESNVTASQKVNNEFENDEVLKYNETNITNINQTELSGIGFSSNNTQDIDKPGLKNNNATNIDESYTIESDTKLNESVTNIPKVETKGESGSYTTTEKYIDLNRRSFEETDIPANNENVTVDSSNVQSESKTQSNVDSENTLNVTVIINTTPANYYAKPAFIYVNDDTSTMSYDTEVNSKNSFNSNSNTTVIESSTNTNVYETTASNKVNDDYETSERLFARSALGSEEEYNIKINTTSITNGSNNTGAANLRESATLNSSTYNTNDIVGRKEADITQVTINSTEIPNVDANTTNVNDVMTTGMTINSTDDNESLARTKHGLNESVVESNSDANVNVYDQADGNITVTNTNNDKATDSSNITISTSTLESKADINLIEEVTNNASNQEVTTIATNAKADSTEKPEPEKLNTTKTSNTPTDLNKINILPGGDIKPGSFIAVNKDESNISGKKTVNTEAKANSEVKENAGSSNYTPITAADSTSATNINNVIQATENRSVGDDNKTDKLLTVIKPDKSSATGKAQATVKPDKSQATIKPNKSQATVKFDNIQKVKPNKSDMDKTDTLLVTVKPDRQKEESKRDSDSTSKSDESSRSVSLERLIYMTSSQDSTSTSAE